MGAFRYMSLNTKMINSITLRSEHLPKTRTKDRDQLGAKKRSELQKVETNIRSLEQKWIEEKIAFDTYNRRYADYLIPELSHNELIMR
jgi:hypothetical protein